MSKRSYWSGTLAIMWAVGMISIILTNLGISDRHPLIISILWFCAGTGIILTGIWKLMEYNREKVIMTAAYVVRVLLLWFELWTGNLLELKVNSLDWKMFGDYSKLLYVGYQNGNVDAYVHVLNAEYHVFGWNEFVARYINIVCLMITLAIVYKIMKKLSVSGTYRWIGLGIVSFMPLGLINSLALIRESMITMLITLSFYCAVNWILRGKQRMMLYAIAASVCAAVLHSGSLCIGVACVFLYAVYDNRTGRYKVKLQGVAALIIIAVAAVVSFQIPSLRASIWAKIPEAADIIGSISRSYLVHRSEHGGSEYLETMNLTGWGDLILYTPIRMLYFLVAPMPMDWRGAKDIVMFFADSMLHICVIVSIVKNIVFTKRFRWTKSPQEGRMDLEYRKGKSEYTAVILLVFITIVAMAIIFAWGTCSAGAAIRHRGKLVGLEAVVLTVFWSLPFRNKGILK